MERGAMGESIPSTGREGKWIWVSALDKTEVYEELDYGFNKVAIFFGPRALRNERMALFLTTEQS